MEWMRTKSVIQRKPTPNAIAAMIVRMPSITTSLLKELCSRLTDRAQAAGDPPAGARVLDDSPCPPGHNTPFPLERSPPVSFKRLLGRSPQSSDVGRGALTGRRQIGRGRTLQSTGLRLSDRARRRNTAKAPRRDLGS